MNKEKLMGKLQFCKDRLKGTDGIRQMGIDDN